MNNTISIIVTVFNVEPYLKKCLDSILGQTYQDLEVILVDDGSTDSSSDICDQYACLDSRVKVIHKKNEGLVRARKTGVQAATGKYVGYVDADDWIEPQMYQCLYNAINASGADMVAAGRIEEYKDKSLICRNRIRSGVYKGKELEDLYSKMIFYGNFFDFGLFPTVWDKLFKRELLERNQLQIPEDIIVGEDVACVYPCILEANTVCILDDCFYHYRKRDDSMLRTRDSRYNERVYILQKYLYKRCKATKYWEILKRQIDVYIMDMIMNGAMLIHDFAFASDICHQFLFPFQSVRQNSRVVLYGAGNVGNKYYRQIKHSGYCKLVGWVDKNAERYKDAGEYKIENPEKLKGMKFDQIVISVMDERVAKEIKQSLSDLGIDPGSCIWESPIF